MIESDGWRRLMEACARQIDEPTFRTWLRPLHLHGDGDELIIGTPKRSAQWIQDRFGEIIAAAAGKPVTYVGCGCVTASEVAA